MSERDVAIAAYYFPNFHVDPRNEQWHGTAWTEWELVKRAESRFEGHLQPRVPLDGYLDEADPDVMAGKIAMATEYGVDAFLFDWYWYDGRPYLERPLEAAFLPNAAAGEMKFALMWANHHWSNIHPWKSATPPTQLASGTVDAGQFEAATDYIVERYFGHPAYLRIDDRPYLSIYELDTLVEGLGGVAAAKAALDGLRARAARAGFAEIHLNAVARERQVLPDDGIQLDGPTLISRLGFDSVTSYVWVHHHPMPTLLTPYADMLAQAADGWKRYAAEYEQPYYPNITVGWDSSPRTVQSDRFNPALGYPHTNIIADASPEQFGRALEQVREFVEQTNVPLVTINAWNEWTEGSYLEPDTLHRHGHLEQIRRVFGPRG
ncbi:glycosyltransferase WbsX family protein [Kribbella sp. WER1]